MSTEAVKVHINRSIGPYLLSLPPRQPFTGEDARRVARESLAACGERHPSNERLAEAVVWSWQAYQSWTGTV